MNGTVKWFNAKKGYGFITGEDQKEYFVHHTAIVSEGFRTLDEGENVTFDVETAEKGLTAVNVKKA